MTAIQSTFLVCMKMLHQYSKLVLFLVIILGLVTILFMSCSLYQAYSHIAWVTFATADLKIQKEFNILKEMVNSLEHSKTLHIARSLEEESAKVRGERNILSRMMNSLAHEKAILQCELHKVKQTDASISGTGGWCEERAQTDSYYHATDEKLIVGLTKFFAGKKVASFGDGRGHYKEAFDRTGQLKLYDAYDGGPYYDKVSHGRVKYLDLSLPQYGLPLYDWVMSLEVAEHIPKQYEAIFLNNIFRHAKEGIVLSWAVPGQGGFHHVNLRSLEYVIKVLTSVGFEHDPVSSKQLQESSSLPWLMNNINVYRRGSDAPVDMNEI